MVFSAADVGRWEVVHAAIAQGFNLATRDRFSSTLLHYAAGKRASLETVKLILSSGQL